MIHCQDAVEKTLQGLRAGFDCAQVGDRLEIVTPYLHPDNDLIEVFVEEVAPGRVRVTDLGETLRRLDTLGMDVFASSKRRFLVEQIASRTHVTLTRGKLEKEGAEAEVGTLLLDVLSAVHAVSDLIYSSKAYEPATFGKEVSIFLVERGIEHTPEVAVIGSTGKRYRVSVGTTGARTAAEVLIQAMSPAQEAAMTPMVNRVIRMWFDVNSTRKKVSLLNDEDYSWRGEDIALLERVSIVQNWTRKEGLIEFISAA